MPDQQITRYLDLGRLLAMLGDWPGSPTGRTFFAFPDRLGDPQEGVLGEADHQTAVGVARTRYNGTPARAFGCWLSREWQDKLTRRCAVVSGSGYTNRSLMVSLAQNA